MAVIRLYKRFYKISSNGTIESYSLINPISISAAVYLKDTATLIETISVIVNESTGIYYADLNPILYSYDQIYDLKWTVQYLYGNSTKILTTSFKLNPINIASEITTEIENQLIETTIEDRLIEVIIL